MDVINKISGYLVILLPRKIAKYTDRSFLENAYRLVNSKGLPDYILRFHAGIGDQFMLSTVAHEIKRRYGSHLWIHTRAPELFENNPDVDIASNDSRFLRLAQCIFAKSPKFDYEKHYVSDPNRNTHILAELCKQAGLVGKISLKPHIYLENEELKSGNIVDRQIVIQSSVMGAVYPCALKEWYADRFCKIVNLLDREYNFVQIGLESDPKIDGCVDLRGKTTIRQAASILNKSRLFIGLAGFLQHLARAVDCPSVIIFRGREKPIQTGYISNINISSDISCSPCWLHSCKFGMKCMDEIQPMHIVEKVRELDCNRSVSLAVEEITI